MSRTVITGTGSYIPAVVQTNQLFNNHVFFDEKGAQLRQSSSEIIEKFQSITGIAERRYVSPELKALDIAAIAAVKAITASGIDRETLDQVIVAHNFGDMHHHGGQSHNVPALANKVKHLLGIKNPDCIAYDILLGCAGWVQALIQTHAYFKAGMAKKVLVIGTETLSKVIDDADRDSMLFADGAGACVIEIKDEGEDSGILSTCSQSHTADELNYIALGCSYDSKLNQETQYLKMKGRKVYEYAVSHVPAAMKKCLDLCGLSLKDVSKVFIHQANEKLDDAILRNLFLLSGETEIPEHIMPMSIQWLGNSSVATVPTLYDLVLRGEVENQQLQKGDVILFAAVGAGMNMNCVCYRQ